MNLLMDTHVIIWAASSPEHLASGLCQKLEDPDARLWYSPISAWEIMLLSEKGLLALKSSPEVAIRSLFKTLPLQEAPLNFEVAVQSRRIKLPHQDPADRFIAATALVYGFTLVTADKDLLRCKQVPVLPAKDQM